MIKRMKKERYLSERNLTRSERYNKNLDRIFDTKRKQDDAFAAFLLDNGYSEHEVDNLRRHDKLNAEIHDNFPEGTLAEILYGLREGKLFTIGNKMVEGVNTSDGKRNMYEELSNVYGTLLGILHHYFDNVDINDRKMVYARDNIDKILTMLAHTIDG